jgi:WD40 repeat protein
VARKIGSFRETQQYFASTIVFSADSTKIVTDNKDTKPAELHVRMVRDPSNYHSIVVPNTSPIDGIGAIAVAMSPSGSRMAAAHDPLPLRWNLPRDTRDPPCRAIQIWNAVDERPLLDLDIGEQRMDCGIKGVAFSHDGKLMFASEGNPASGCPKTSWPAWHDYVAVFSTKDWEHLWNICTGSLDVSMFAISPDDRFIAIAGFSYLRPGLMETHPIITLVDLTTRQVVREIDGAFPDANKIMALAWSPDGKRLAAGGGVEGSYPGPNAVKLFDPLSGELVKAERSENAWVTAIAFTADGRYLVEGEVNKAVRIWDNVHERLLQSISVKRGDGFRDGYTTLAISPDSRYLAISEWHEVTIYELK